MSQRKLDLDRALADLATALEFPPTPTWPPRSPPGWARPRPRHPRRLPLARARRWLGGLGAGGGWPRPGWPSSCWPRPCWSSPPGPGRRWPGGSGCAGSGSSWAGRRRPP